MSKPNHYNSEIYNVVINLLSSVHTLKVRPLYTEKVQIHDKNAMLAFLTQRILLLTKMFTH